MVVATSKLLSYFGKSDGKSAMNFNSALHFSLSRSPTPCLLYCFDYYSTTQTLAVFATTDHYIKSFLRVISFGVRNSSDYDYGDFTC